MADGMPTHGSTQLRSVIYGAAVGDALGVPFEFLTRDTFACTDMTGFGTHNQPAGTWSDDTAMLLATCDSIRTCRAINVDHMRKCFCDWLNNGAYTPDGVVFDVGGTTSEALSLGQGLDGTWDNGNGSLMRIAPLALTNADDNQIRAVSAITHAHAISTEACVSFVHTLRHVLKEPDRARAAICDEQASTSRDEVRSGGFVLDTLQAALWCFATTASYGDCVLAAVNLGSDTDTTACVAGALAGAYYGFDAIPASWIQALRGKDVLEGCLFE